MRTAAKRSVLMVLATLCGLLPGPLTAQGPPSGDSLLDRARALARSVPGERPRSIHVLKIVESAGPLGNYVAVQDSTRIASCYSAFQIRWRDRWIVVDAALDREMLGASSRARFFQDRNGSSSGLNNSTVTLPRPRRNQDSRPPRPDHRLFGRLHHRMHL